MKKSGFRNHGNKEVLIRKPASIPQRNNNFNHFSYSFRLIIISFRSQQYTTNHQSHLQMNMRNARPTFSIPIKRRELTNYGDQSVNSMYAPGFWSSFEFTYHICDHTLQNRCALSTLHQSTLWSRSELISD